MVSACLPACQSSALWRPCWSLTGLLAALVVGGWMMADQLAPDRVAARLPVVRACMHGPSDAACCCPPAALLSVTASDGGGVCCIMLLDRSDRFVRGRDEPPGPARERPLDGPGAGGGEAHRAVQVVPQVTPPSLPASHAAASQSCMQPCMHASQRHTCRAPLSRSSGPACLPACCVCVQGGSSGHVRVE